jgi:hypothetical protein
MEAMMSIAISTEARNILRTAGWNEQYVGGIEDVDSYLEIGGFNMTPVAREFIGEFHGIKLRVQNLGGLSFVHFDVFEEMGWIEEADRPFLDALVRAPLFPIGHGGGTLLFLTPTGEMILLNDQWLGFSQVPTIREGMDLILGIHRPPQYDGIPLRKDQIPPGFR